MMASFDNLQHAEQAVLELRALADRPSMLEMIDINVLEMVNQQNPNLLKDVIQTPFPNVVLFVEYDSGNDRVQKKAVKKSSKIFEKYATSLVTETEPDLQMNLLKVRQATGTLLTKSDGTSRALPLVDDAIVPLDKLKEYIEGAYAICNKLAIKPAIWGHIGEGNLQLQPTLDLSQIGDRQKAFRLMDEYYSMVINLGGSISGERNDGRLRAPYVERQYGSEVYALFARVKQIFDPYSILNPGVKLGTSVEDIKSLVRSDFNFGHIYDHLPRS